jgi:hypothetical protein
MIISNAINHNFCDKKIIVVSRKRIMLLPRVTMSEIPGFECQTFQTLKSDTTVLALQGIPFVLYRSVAALAYSFVTIATTNTSGSEYNNQAANCDLPATHFAFLRLLNLHKKRQDATKSLPVSSLRKRRQFCERRTPKGKFTCCNFRIERRVSVCI